MPLRHMFSVALVAATVVACAGAGEESATVRPSGAAIASPVATAATATTPTADATDTPEEPTDEPTAEPTPEPNPDAPTLFYTDDVVTVTQADEPHLDIVVSSVSQKKSYGSGYFVDRPKKGNIYLQALISYTALADGATYNPYDWQIFCNEEAVDGYAFVSDGPEPELHSGTLPKGRKAKGWLVYEVPAKGRCLLSYGANSFIDRGALFEVLVRAK